MTLTRSQTRKTDLVGEDLFASNSRPVNNLKNMFREMRNYLAGNLEGITRDETMMENLVRLIFCKMHDEKSSRQKSKFRVFSGENAESVSARIRSLFEEVKGANAGIFDENEKISMSDSAVFSFVSRIQNCLLLGADRDVVGDAFESLISTSFRGGSGQFFTPRNVAQMMIDILQPAEGEKIIDPACGSGGFLVTCYRYLVDIGASCFSIVGIDKDSFVAKLAKTYLSILSGSKPLVFNQNSLNSPKKWDSAARHCAPLGSFDVVLTNPPFGAKIPVVGNDTLSQYSLGKKWIYSAGRWIETEALHEKQPPQILFIERCLQFLRTGGRMGIVLPDGIFGNSSDRYIWEYLSRNAHIFGVVSLAQEAFQPSTHTKTSVLFLEKKNSKNRGRRVFMAVARAVGHDKNGKPLAKINRDGSVVTDKIGEAVIDDDLPEITARFIDRNRGKEGNNDRLGFWVDQIADHVYIPEYYNPEIISGLDTLRSSGKYDMVTIGDMLASGKIEITRGNEIGSRCYGTGNVPFVRTTDIVNWEIKIDPVKSVSEEIYRQYRRQQDIRAGDILFVSDGTFLIGRSSMVAKMDEKIIIQSHIKKIRVIDERFIDPYYLFYLLNTPIVRGQIGAKIFVQATISTLGKRLLEVALPISKDRRATNRIARKVQDVLHHREKLRTEIIRITSDTQTIIESPREKVILGK